MQEEKTTMPTKAKIYIGLVIILGFALLAGSVALRSDFPDMPRYISYLLLALLASTFKVRLPGITGTISVNFLLILIGIADFTFTETITMGCAAIVIQCVWRAKRRPQLVQIFFNVAALALSVAGESDGDKDGTSGSCSTGAGVVVVSVGALSRSSSPG